MFYSLGKNSEKPQGGSIHPDPPLPHCHPRVYLSYIVTSTVHRRRKQELFNYNIFLSLTLMLLYFSNHLYLLKHLAK